MTTIALLTDFGYQDSYVGVMKGVMAGIAPNAQTIDLTHGIPPQDLHAAAFALLTSYKFFPKDTIFCCVVDPGVGGDRLAVAARLESQNSGPFYIVCPDNGLLTPVLHELPAAAAVTLDNPIYHLGQTSATFHGRDIFAPVAAHLAAGHALAKLGSKLEPGALIQLDWPQAERLEDGWRAKVVYIDSFGNLVTNLKGAALEPPLRNWQIDVRETHLETVSRTFSDVVRGAPLAYVGSSGFLEVALRQGNAHRELRVDIGETVLVKRRND